MISVCMATYNGGKYIEEQVRSILPQLSEGDELIVSDDHSADDTIDILKSIRDERIRIFTNPGQKGYAGNFENALRQAGGDIIFLSDQDDVWMDGKADAVLRELERCDFVVTDAEIVDSNRNPLYPSHFAHTSVRQGFLLNFWKTRYIGACMAFRRRVLQKALPFPRNRALCAHDYWLAIVAELYFRVGLIHKPCLRYRRHDGNASSGGLDKSNASIYRRIIKRIYCGLHLIRICLK